jgi:hypothetical protein
MAFPISEDNYQVTSVTRADINGQEWYEYVISNSTSTIKGQRQGTLKQVNKHAQEYSEQLNDRMKNNYSYYRSQRNVAGKKTAGNDKKDS